MLDKFQSDIVLASTSREQDRRELTEILEKVKRDRLRAIIVFALGLALAATLNAQDSVDAESRDLLRDQAVEALRAGRWLEAEKRFAAITEGGGDPVVVYGSALAKFNLGKVLEAGTLIDSAVKLLENEPQQKALLADCLVLSGIIDARLGDNSKAVKKLQTAVGLVPDNFDAVFSLARALFGNGDIRNSAAYFGKAVELRPGDPQARFFFATALENLGETERALDQYRSIVAADANNVNGLLGLGVLLIKIEGDGSREGIAALRKVNSLDGRNYEARMTLGKSLLRLKEYEEAIEHLKIAAELAPGNPEPHYQLALAYRKLGRLEDSNRSMEIVRSIHEKRRGIPGEY